MKPAYFEVLSAAEVERIDAASMNILGSVGLRVDLKRARDDLSGGRSAGRRGGPLGAHSRGGGALGPREGAEELHPVRGGSGLPDGDRHRPGQFRRAGHPDEDHGHGDRGAPTHHARGRPQPPAADRCARSHRQQPDGPLAQRHPHDHHPRRGDRRLGPELPQVLRHGNLRRHGQRGHDADGVDRGGRKGGARRNARASSGSAR